LVDKSQITAIITRDTSLQQKATELITAANANGGRDNVTVVLVQNNKTPNRPEATKPAAVLKKSPNVTEGIPTTKQDTVTSRSDTGSNNITAQKSGNGLTVLFAILCLAFAASSVWLYLQWQKSKQLLAEPVKTVQQDQQPRNPDEIKLQNALNNLKGDTLKLSDTTFKQPIVISDTLHILKDTLFIKTKGNIVFKRDSAFNGPAMDIAAPCKVIVLENIKFEGFETAISVFNTSLYLRGTQFVNCRLAIQKQYLLANEKSISADFPLSKIITDTLAKTTKKPDGAR